MIRAGRIIAVASSLGYKTVKVVVYAKSIQSVMWNYKPKEVCHDGVLHIVVSKEVTQPIRFGPLRQQ